MEDGEPVKVLVRIRPEDVQDRAPMSPQGKSRSIAPFKCINIVNDQSIRLVAPDGVNGARKSVSAIDDKDYIFDKVFPDSCTQEDIYKSVCGLVHAVIRGYNATIFAYGCTGSGKSYSMTGTNSFPGIIPRTISDVFSNIEERAKEETDAIYYVRISYVELYNNKFKNLLEFASKRTEADKEDDGLARPNRTGDKIEVKESAKTGVYLSGNALRIPVTSAKEAFQLISKGNRYRAVGSTQCNDISSRSHAILTIHVESRIFSSSSNSSASTTLANNNSSGNLSPTRSSLGMTGSSSLSSTTTSTNSNLFEWRFGKIHLVDLAGSERLTMSGAEGETLIETQNINLSLSALGDVLQALSHNASLSAQQHNRQTSGSGSSAIASYSNSGFPSSSLNNISYVPVPYRNSKLTYLLKDSLGGNSKTVMLTTLRNHSDYYQQSLVSLMYSARAKKVKNHSSINRNSVEESGIHAVTTEIERLKSRLEERTIEFDRLKLLHQQDSQENNSLKSRLEELTSANEREKLELESQLSHIIHSQAGQLASQRDRIVNLQQEMQLELVQSQNRIAEQEREISWLKKELEVSAKSVQQPKEQLERMQRILEAWQSQVHSTQLELTTALKENDSLRSKLSKQTNELQQLEQEKKELTDEMSQRSQEVTEFSLMLSQKEHDLESVMKDLLETRDKNKVLESDISRQMKMHEDNTQQFRNVAQELQSLKESKEKDQQRMKMLEKEKDFVKSKLDHVLSSLEAQTSGTLQEMSIRYQEAENRFLQTQDDLHRIEKDKLHWQNAAQQLEGQLKSLSMQVQASQSEIIQTEDKWKQKYRELEQNLTQNQQNLRQATEKWSQREQKLMEESQNKDRKLQSLENLMKKVQNDLQSSQESADNLKRQLQSEIQQWSRKVEDLKELQKSETQQFQINMKKRDEEWIKKIESQEKEWKEEWEAGKEKALKEERKKHEDLMKVHRQNWEVEMEKWRNEEKTSNSQLLQDSLQTIQVTSQQLLTSVKDEHEKEIKSLKERYSREVELLQSTHEEQMKKQLLDMKEVHDREIEKVKIQAEEQFNMKFQSMKTSLEQQFQIEMKNQKASYEDKFSEKIVQIEDLEMKLQQAMEQGQSDMKSSIDTLKKRYEAKFKTKLDGFRQKEEQLETQFKEILAATEDSLRFEFQSTLQHQRDELEEIHKNEVESLKKSHENEIRNLQNQFQAQHTYIQEKLKESDVYSQNILKANEDNLKTLESSWLLKLKERNDEHENLRRKLDDDWKSRFEEQEKKFSQEIRDLKDTKDAEIKKIHEKHDRDVLTLKQSLEEVHERSLRSLNDSHDKEVQRLQEELKSVNSTVESMKARHEKEVKQIREGFQDENSLYERRLEDLRKSHQSDLNSLKESLKSRWESLEETSRLKIEHLEKELEKVQLEKSELVTAYSLRQALDLKSQETSKHEWEQLWQQSLKESQFQHEKSLESLRSQHAVEISEFQARVKSLSLRHDEERKFWESEHLKELERERLHLQSTLQEVQQSHLDQIESLQQRGQKTLQEWQESHREKVEELRQQKETMEQQFQVRFQEVSSQLQEMQLKYSSLLSTRQQEKLELVEQSKLEQRSQETKSRLFITQLEMEKQEFMEEIQRSFKNKLRNQETESRQELEKVEASHRLKIKELEELHDQEKNEIIKQKIIHEGEQKEKYEIELQNLKEQMKAMKESHSQELQTQHEKIVRQKKKLTDSQQKIEKLRNEHEEICRNHELEMNILHARLQDLQSRVNVMEKDEESQNENRHRLENEIRLLKVQHEENLKKLKEDLELEFHTKLRAEILEVENRHDLQSQADLVKEREKLKKSYDELLEKLQNENSNLHSKDLKTQIDRLNNQWENKLQHEMNRLRSEYQESWEVQSIKLTEKHEREMKEALENLRTLLAKQHETSLMEIKNIDHQNLVEKLKSAEESWQERVFDLNQKNEERVLKLEESFHSRHETELQAVKNLWEANLKENENFWLKENEKLKNEIEEWQSRFEAISNEKHTVSSELSTRLTDVQLEHEKLKAEFRTLQRNKEVEVNSWQEKCRTLEKDHREKLQQLEDERKLHEKKILSDHEHQLRSVESMISFERTQSSHEVEELQKEVASLKSQLSSVNNSKMKAVEEMKTLQHERNEVVEKAKQLEFMTLQTISSEVEQSRLQLESNFQAKLFALRQEESQKFLAEKLELQRSFETERNSLLQEIQAWKTQWQASLLDQESRETLWAEAAHQRELDFSQTLSRALEDQQTTLSKSYFSLLQQQVDSLLMRIESQQHQKNSWNSSSSLTQIEEMQSKFLNMLQNLPEIWRDQFRSFAPNVSDSTASTTTHMPGNGNKKTEDMVSTSDQVEEVKNRKNNHRIPLRAPNYLSDEGSGLSLSTSSNPSNSSGYRDSYLPPPPPSSSSSSSSSSFSLHSSPRSFSSSGHSHTINHSSSASISGAATSSVWDAPTVPTSDQLISAILDGDIPGIRSIIRSQSNGVSSSSSTSTSSASSTMDLQSPLWKERLNTLLPFHRAITGLQFHGQTTKLLDTLKCLSQLGCPLSLQDNQGNSALHKAIQVCTSTSVVEVVKWFVQQSSHNGSHSLRSKGISEEDGENLRFSSSSSSSSLSINSHSSSFPQQQLVQMRNKSGETPVMLECQRLRAASLEVLELLFQAGADPDVSHPHYGRVEELSGESLTVLWSPLIWVLARGALSCASQSSLNIDLAFPFDPLSSSSTSSSTTISSSQGLNSTSHSTSMLTSSFNPRNSSEEKSRTAGRRIWVKVAALLVRAGASFLPSFQTSSGLNCLHLLWCAFPPSSEDWRDYVYLVTQALKEGVSPLTPDSQGRSPLFLLAWRMNEVSLEDCRNPGSLVREILPYCLEDGFGSRRGSHSQNDHNSMKGSELTSTSRSSQAREGLLGTSDRQGRSLFDLLTTPQRQSCLAACKPLFLQVVSDSVVGHGGGGGGGGGFPISFEGDFDDSISLISNVSSQGPLIPPSLHANSAGSVASAASSISTISSHPSHSHSHSHSHSLSRGKSSMINHPGNTARNTAYEDGNRSSGISSNGYGNGGGTYLDDVDNNEDNRSAKSHRSQSKNLAMTNRNPNAVATTTSTTTTMNNTSTSTAANNNNNNNPANRMIGKMDGTSNSSLKRSMMRKPLDSSPAF